MTKIAFKKVHGDAQVPVRATADSAGFDLYSPVSVIIPPNQRLLVRTGIACAIPPGWCGQIWPRSGMATKQGVDRLAGLIDADYRGEVHVSLINHGLDPVEIRAGDRIAQMIIVPCLLESELVHVLPATDRGVNGFGSTGK